MRPPFFAFYPADFANDINVEAMSTLAVGAYILLLCKAWQSDPPGSLPSNDQILARLARLDAVAWAEVRAEVLACFELRTDGRLHQARLRREYDRALATMKARRKGGSKGAEVTNARKSGATGKVSGSAGGSAGGSAAGSAGAEPGERQMEIESLPSEDDRPPTPAGVRSVGPPESIPFDPVRHAEAQRKLFERRWREAGLRAFSRLDRSLWTLLESLLADPWWAEHYPAALAKAGGIPFLASGAGRRNGALDVSDFIRDPDMARKIIDGKYDPHAPATIPLRPAGGKPTAADVIARKRAERESQKPAEGAA